MEKRAPQRGSFFRPHHQGLLSTAVERRGSNFSPTDLPFFASVEKGLGDEEKMQYT
jgi:hypothetical protein